MKITITATIDVQEDPKPTPVAFLPETQQESSIPFAEPVIEGRPATKEEIQDAELGSAFTIMAHYLRDFFKRYG